MKIKSQKSIRNNNIDSEKVDTDLALKCIYYAKLVGLYQGKLQCFSIHEAASSAFNEVKKNLQDAEKSMLYFQEKMLKN